MKRYLIYISWGLICFLWFWSFATPFVTPGTNALAEAAFHNGGILNPPGYPLFGIFSSLFKHIPFISASLLGNLMAVVCGVIALMLSLRIIELLVGKGSNLNTSSLLISALSLSVFITNPLLISQFSHLEKYSVAILFFLGFLLTSQHLYYQKKQSPLFLILFGSLSSLAILGHYSYALTVVVVSIYLLVTKFSTFRSSWPFAYVFGLAIGLAPILFLPWSSSHQPLLDWGNPETFDNLKQMLLRNQYQGLNIPLTFDYFIHQIQNQYSHLLFPATFGISLIGIVSYFSIVVRKPSLLLGLVLLVTTGESIAAFVRFYSPFTGTKAINMGFDRMMWPFFLAWFLVFSILATASFIRLGRTWNYKLKSISIFTLISLALFGGVHSLKEVQTPALIPEMVQNLSSSVDDQSIILTSVDFLYFSMLLAQQRKQMDPKVIIIHTSLIQMPWYLDSLERQYSTDFSKVFSNWDKFQNLAQQFFSSDGADAKQTLRHYNLLMRDLLSWKKKILVIESTHLMPMILSPILEFRRQPFLIGYWLFKKVDEVQPLNWSKWRFTELLRTDAKSFPWAYGVKRMLLENWLVRKPMEKILFPENRKYFEKFEEQLRLSITKDESP